ncbi:hypothetical protein KJ641_04250 [Patescibacteria group bacterium]|nr:hypothetical protein [Patescibacteria group bacterium]
MRKIKKLKLKYKKWKFKRHLLHFLKKNKLVTLLVILLFILIIGLITYYILTLPEPLIDDRPLRIEAYFEKYNMPLAGHGQTFVDVADTCEIDWRLLPAIAVQESTGGKFMQLNNPFGWGGAQIPFESIDDAIREVGYHLCGFNSSTDQWYSTTSTYKKLYYYNGTVAPTYPNEVIWIMDQF